MLQQYATTDLELATQKLQSEARRTRRLATALVLGLYGSLMLAGYCFSKNHNPLQYFGGGGVLILLLRPVLQNQRYKDALNNTRNALSQERGRKSLSVLLFAWEACSWTGIAEEITLRDALQSRLRHCLPRTTEGELQALTLAQRKTLAKLVGNCVGTALTKPIDQPYQEPPREKVELATAALLALGSLREPSARKSAHYLLKHFHNVPLREAAQEYLSSLT